MAIQTIEMFVTNDNKVHQTREIAKEHQLNMVCEIIDKRIESYFKKGKLSASDRFELVKTIVGTHEDAEKLYRALKNIID